MRYTLLAVAASVLLCSSALAQTLPPLPPVPPVVPTTQAPGILPRVVYTPTVTYYAGQCINGSCAVAAPTYAVGACATQSYGVSACAPAATGYTYSVRSNVRYVRAPWRLFRRRAFAGGCG